MSVSFRLVIELGRESERGLERGEARLDVGDRLEGFAAECVSAVELLDLLGCLTALRFIDGGGRSGSGNGLGDLNRDVDGFFGGW